MAKKSSAAAKASTSKPATKAAASAPKSASKTSKTAASSDAEPSSAPATPATPKKPAAKKPPAKKPAAKKPAAKMPAANKPVSKASPKKAPGKKAAAPKVAAAPTPASAQTTPPAAPAAPAPVTPTKVVPIVLGKHAANTYPEGSPAADFRCFGPPATQDGAFDSVRICDMGCFTQDGKDSNKYYHGAVVQQKDSGNWYAYFEWGRTGASKPSFQFVGCRDEAHAIREFAAQLHSKNDRRGEWVTVAGLRTLRAKKGKDCYLVRPQATRSTGLPDARSIKTNEGARASKSPAASTASSAKASGPGAPKVATKADPQTYQLLCDLALATVAYTRGSMADDSLPTQKAIDEARQILTEAQKRVLVAGDESAQLKDKELVEMTTLMYSRIPKKKPLGAAASTWLLTGKNILAWQQDLDAFESALYNTDVAEHQDVDPYANLGCEMRWIDPKSELGKFLTKWWPSATNNRHPWIRGMKIKNLWELERASEKGLLEQQQDLVLADKPKIKERALFQTDHPLHDAATRQRTKDSNTALLFHGTRSVNVSGIISNSLRMPKQLVGVVITGAMFGPGLYFADDWKKSAGYTSAPGSYWASGGGAVAGRSAFMFCAEVVLGEPYVAKQAHGYVEPPKGYHSVFGKGGSSILTNNEFVVYKPEQMRLRYLVEFDKS